MQDKPLVRVVSAEIRRDGCYLITQRRAEAVLPLLWEFPGGRVHDGEAPAEALQRAVRMRIGAQVEVGEHVLTVSHEYANYTVELSVFRCSLGGEEPWADGVAALAWVEPENLEDYPFPGADQQTVDLLLRDAE